MAQNLNDYSLMKLRIVLPSWPMSTIKELLGKIRATFKQYGEAMKDDEVIELLRKESIIRKELYRRIQYMQTQRNHNKIINHKIQEQFIGNIIESPFRRRK